MQHPRLSGADLFINDVTLRDGEQAPGNTMTTTEKTEIARQLVRLGIPGIEAGFAVASPGDFEAVEHIASDIGSLTLPIASAESPYPRISSLARLNEMDIDHALRSVRPAEHRGVHTFISTSAIQQVKFASAIRSRGGNPESRKDFVDMVVLPQIEQGHRQIRESDPEAFIQFSPEDWTRTDEPVSDQVLLAAATHGARIINLPDTVGAAIPLDILERVQHVRGLLDQHGFCDVVISWHGHNDTGMGVANALMALYGGARQFETTILGIGERTGNFSFEGFLAALDANITTHEKRLGIPIRDTLVRKETMRTALLVAATLGIRIPREHPIVGENAFAHESGIHQHGVVAGRESGKMVYEILKPERYGATSKLILGKHSGWAGLREFFKKNRLPFKDSDRRKFVNALSKASDNRRKGLSDSEVLEQVYYPVVLEVTGGPHVLYVSDVDPVGECKAVSIGTRDGANILGIASGSYEGRVDALVRGLKALIPDINISHDGFEVHSLGEGSDTKAHARVTLENSYKVTRAAESANTDQAIEAALIASFNALYAMESYARAETETPLPR